MQFGTQTLKVVPIMVECLLNLRGSDVHIQIPPTNFVGLIVHKYHCGYCKLQYH